MMTVGSNSQPEIDALVAHYKESLERGRQSGLESLQAFRDAGAALCQIKDIAGRGKFGAIADQRCGRSKQWRARLMMLDRNWDDIKRALQWAEGLSRELGARAFSVDGALALLKEWRRAQDSTTHPTTRATRSRPVGREALLREMATLKSENAALKNQLSAAKTDIVGLEEQLAALRSSMPAAQPLDDRTLPILLNECSIKGPVSWTCTPSK
jgi:hypothetical protein